jgi:hypothetical protein
MMPVEREFVDHGFCYTGTLLACARFILVPNGLYMYTMRANSSPPLRLMRAVLAQTVLTPDATTTTKA